MHVTRLEAWPVELKLSEPYTIAYGSVDSTTNVFLRLYTDSPHVGHGCAAPDPTITGETPEQVLSALRDRAAPVLAGLDPTRPALVYQRVHSALGAMPSTLAALDMAVLDLVGQAAGLPVWRLLGGARESIRTSMTIGILDERATVEQARRWVREGFTFLKLKGGLDPESDSARVLGVRAAVGADVDLAFDANQGYTPEECRTFLHKSASARLVFVEQPTPRDDPAALGVVQDQSPVPIMADEALTTPGQALALAAGRLVRLFNVKLMKVGGFHPARVIDAVGASAGVGVMVGCLDECALGIAAGLHFALGSPNVAYADLDGHFALLADPSAGSVRVRGGVLVPNDRPGLGVELGG